MIKKFETIDSISFVDDGKVDTQFLRHKGFLERIGITEASGHIRSKVVYGRFQIPEVGKVFSLVAEPYREDLSPELDLRNITTSRVTKVEKNENEVYFETLNSRYKIILR